MSTSTLVRDACTALVVALQDVDDDGSWTATGCRGWAVRNLTQHCLTDVQRGLVSLHSPTDAPVDPDWEDERYARVATGRAEPTADERRRLGPLVARLPVFS